LKHHRQESLKTRNEGRMKFVGNRKIRINSTRRF